MSQADPAEVLSTGRTLQLLRRRERALQAGVRNKSRAQLALDITCFSGRDVPAMRVRRGCSVVVREHTRQERNSRSNGSESMEAEHDRLRNANDEHSVLQARCRTVSYVIGASDRRDAPPLRVAQDASSLMVLSLTVLV